MSNGTTPTPIPRVLLDAPLTRPTEIFVIGGAIAIMGNATYNVFKTKRLTYMFLFMWNSLLTYWMETAGDWGQHLIYSPKFWCHHLLEWLPFKSPNDPIFMPFAYALYWTAHSVLLMQLAPIFMKKFPKFTLLQAVIVWDILVEGICTYLGYWTYDPGFGPVIQWSTGGRQPLTWPILLMSGWPNLVAYWGGKPPLTKLNIMERWFGLGKWTEPKEAYVPANRHDEEDYPTTETTPLTGGKIMTATEAYDAALEYRVIESVPRWKFEAWRFLAWFICFQVSFFVNFIVPLIGLRLVTGHESIYVP